MTQDERIAATTLREALMRCGALAISDRADGCVPKSRALRIREIAHRTCWPEDAADVPAEDAEMWCERCGRRHGVVWFAPSEVWNAVMREGVRANPDEFGFCCPICFMQLADERGVGTTIWEVLPEVIHAD